jgi:hypothetical protein
MLMRLLSSDSGSGEGSGEGARILSRSERADLIRVIVPAGIVWPAEGEALTIVPGMRVGEGQGLFERKRGWMFVSRKGLYSHVEFGFDVVGESRSVDVGEGRGGWTRLSRESGVGALRRRLGMLRMLLLPRRRGRLLRFGALSVVGDGEGDECVEVVSIEAFWVLLDGHRVASE